MAYYNSNDVQVFPTIRRNDVIDRKARLNTEENIISISNRITGNQSYILDGLNISSDGKKLSSGVCVINGYYFKIENTINLSNQNQNENNYLYFQIKVAEKSSINGVLSFKELIPFDSNYNYLDYGNDFIGLKIIFNKTMIDEEDTIDNNTFQYNLLIAQKKDGKWVNDNIESRIISDSQFIMDDREIS